MSFLRRKGPLALTIVLAVAVFSDYYFIIPAISTIADFTKEWAVILAAFALPMGAVSMSIQHINLIVKRKEGQMIYSIALLASFFIMLLFGLRGIYITGVPTSDPVFMFLNTTIFVGIGAALYSCTGFYIASAAYRAFRARNWLAAVLLVTGIFVMFKNMSLIQAIFPSASSIGTWLFSISAGGQRGVTMGIALGVIFYTIRYLLGYEKIVG